ncbi:hypothetical protein ASPCAL11884 [Aspergillus calidoustus]|uniref:FAD-binding domain-containing protein n=1 Tax=Aspergillus calidoustus TaxID=454130 RepID=A0A0U5GB13_ASPCI|nr:hypothetical protein ASPCAL11884 [Aspergillus calidoustus]
MDAVPTPVSRAKLIKLLYNIAVSLGITFSFGQRVVNYFDDVDGSAAGVLTASGARHKAELVVAADGVGSKSSKLILGNDSRPKSSGFAVYRVAFPTAIAHRDKEVANNFPAPTDGSDDTRIFD